jgi:methionyl-tRNA synthetase
VLLAVLRSFSIVNHFGGSHFMNSPKREILVTSALPYANGDIHLGHMLEHIQTDIWVRFMRSMGHTCYAVCGTDAHGTGIMLNAEKAGEAPEVAVERLRKAHIQDFERFNIRYDIFHTTHSSENQQLSNYIYEQLKRQGHIDSKTITQLFDPEKQLFLADRYIKGACPKCKTEDQYGDNCESCGATYSPTELINPRSTISGATPIEKASEHFFFKLADFEGFLKEWTRSGTLQPEVSNKLDEWLQGGLQSWDISRDAPYFGFEIPGETGKYFYVWLDAPVGYMAGFKALCNQSGENFDKYWGRNAQTELYHFIGKDIVNFHALFWPSMLHSAGFRTPTGVFAHGYITVNGEKMSKSRGTFVKAKTYLKHLHPEYLRYYYAGKLTSRIDDIDLSFDDFVQRVNSDVVGKVVNIASRSANFVKKSGGRLSDTVAEPELLRSFITAGDSIATHYESREYAKAIREIMELADKANEYIQAKAPWVLSKQEDKAQEVLDVCSLALNLFRQLMVYLAPVLPEMSVNVQTFLNLDSMDWSSRTQPLVGHKINKFKPLMTRVDPDKVQAMVEDSKETATIEMSPATQALNQAADQTALPGGEAIADEIEFADFAKVDLRIATIVDAQPVAGADKLLQLTLDIGEEKPRKVFSGIKSAYQPEQLVGRQTVMVANLKPRKMKFGWSEGMVLAAGPGGKELWLLEPHAGAQPGMRVL